MALFSDIDEQAIFLSRTNSHEPLSSFAHYPFELDNVMWPSVEHYFQAMKFTNQQHQNNIREAKSPELARSRGRSRLKKMRPDWGTKKRAYMTRASYIKCRTYPQIANQLMVSNPKKIIENNQYDYFWGCGRDRRGLNVFGEILMDIRQKLLSINQYTLDNDPKAVER